MKTPILLAILCGVLLCVGMGLVFSGVVSYRQAGICFGICEQDRREEFARTFPEWFARKAECGPRGEEDRALIAFLHPDLLADIDSKNQSFTALSVREQNGALSVGERSKYLDDPWRVILMVQKKYKVGDLLSATRQELPYEEHSTWVRQCPVNGLANDNYRTENRINDMLRSGTGSVKWDYCEGFVSVLLQTDLPRGRHFSSLYLNERAYSHLSKTGELDAFMKQMETDSSRDFDLRRSAENQVQAMPATDFPLESLPFYELTIKNRIEQIYLQGKCQ
ncbi:hypothetical protein [Sneathiella sp.]|uniref:hypothetical protein n=1 Tax=Sneathiella sp. TaxID=1964365 RepID=UPI003561AC91